MRRLLPLCVRCLHLLLSSFFPYYLHIALLIWDIIRVRYQTFTNSIPLKRMGGNIRQVFCSINLPPIYNYSLSVCQTLNDKGKKAKSFSPLCHVATQVWSPANPHAMRAAASGQGHERSHGPSSAILCWALWTLSCTRAGGCWSPPQGKVMGQPLQTGQAAGTSAGALFAPASLGWRASGLWAHGALREAGLSRSLWTPLSGEALQLRLEGNPVSPSFLSPPHPSPPLPSFTSELTAPYFKKSTDPVAEWKTEESHKVNMLGAHWGHSCKGRKEKKKKSNKRYSNKENPFSIYQVLLPQPLWMRHLLHSLRI